MAYLVCPCLTAIRLKRQEDKTLRIKDTSGLHLNRVRPSHSFTHPLSPPSLPPSLLPLRKFDSVLSSLFGMRLALGILRPHSLTLTVSLSHCLTVSLSHCLTVSLSHCLSLSLISLISLISFSSLSSLSPLSLSPLCLSSFRLSSLSSLAGGSGQRATYKGLFTPASKKSAVFFPTSLPSTFPFWSASFRTPPWPQVRPTSCSDCSRRRDTARQCG